MPEILSSGYRQVGKKQTIFVFCWMRAARGAARDARPAPVVSYRVKCSDRGRRDAAAAGAMTR
jgi:hypothetical protein